MIVLDEATDLMKEVLPELNPPEDAYNKVKSVFVKMSFLPNKNEGYIALAFRNISLVLRLLSKDQGLPMNSLRHACSMPPPSQREALTALLMEEGGTKCREE